MKKTTLFGLCFSLLFLLNSCSQKKAQIDYLNISSDDKKSVIQQGYEHNTLIINYPLNATGQAKLLALGFKQEKTCPCNPSLNVWKYTGAGLIPEGEVKGTAEDQGGTGVVTKNYTVTKPFVLRPKKGKILRDKYPQPIGDRINIQSGSKKSMPTIIPTSPVANTVVLTIIDSGVDYNNPTLQSHLHVNPSGSTFCGTAQREGRYGLNMRRVTRVNPPWWWNWFEPIEPIDRNNHGTFINGIIAGTSELDLASTTIADNSYQGGNENVTISQLNVNFVERGTDNGFLFDALCGIHYAISKGSKVINASWRVLSDDTNVADMNAFLPTLREVSAKDVLLVTGSGNDTLNFDTDRRRAWPAAFTKILPDGTPSGAIANNILTVGAWDFDAGKIGHFSNRGANLVDVYAPGVQVASFMRNNEVGIGQGTSFATPYVARTAAILRGVMPVAKAGEIKRTIMNQALPNGGSSLLQQSNAVQAVRVRQYATE